MEKTVISSFVVRIHPDKQQEIEKQLLAISGLEIHVYEEGKFVITLNAPSEDELIRAYRHMKNTKNLLSVDLVFSGFDGDDQDYSTQPFPDWLNQDIDAKQIKYSGNPKQKF